MPKEPLKEGLEASTVPSTPATLGYMLDKYGTLKLAQVLEPAIDAATKGFKVTALQHALINRECGKLTKDQLIAKNYFKNGLALRAGEVLCQPELASCLKQMAVAGWEDFYLGSIAKTIIADMEARCGLITQADLCQVPVPIERPVLRGNYRGVELATFPPPGAGKALVQILNILENFTRSELAPETDTAAVILAFAFRAALRDRERMPVDPALYLQSTNKVMLDKGYAKELAQRIESYLELSNQDTFNPPPAAGETTHLSVADAAGNVVGITQSIELVFGSKRMADKLGFFYNNYMSAFNYKDMMHPYYLLPGVRPWSSVAPTLMFKDKKPWLILGSPGSERISTSLAQVITRVIDAGQSLAQAVAGPRLHSSSRGKVLIEVKRFKPGDIAALERAGFQIVRRGAYSFYLGCVQAVMLPLGEQEDFVGVSDPRRDGSARGPAAFKKDKGV